MVSLEYLVSCLYLTLKGPQGVVQPASPAAPEVSSAPSLGPLEGPSKVLEFVI